MADTWMKELEEAMRLADDITARIDEASAGGMSKGEKSKLVAGTKRKLMMLDNKVTRLDNLLQTTLRNQITEKEKYRRQDMIIGLRFRMKQMNSNLNTSQTSTREDLLSEGTRGPPVETNKTAGLDNYGIILYQRQAMTEQDEELAGIEQSVKSTKHIALTVNEELDLHATLLDDLDEHADYTNSQLRTAQKRLTILAKRAGGVRSLGCMCIMLAVIVVLLLIILKLIKVW